MQAVIDPLNREIIRAVGRAARSGVTPVYPSWVCAWLPVSISDRRVRARMAKMADDGLLIRYGWQGGYSTVDVRVTQLREALARAEKALAEAQELAEELALVDREIARMEFVA